MRLNNNQIGIEFEESGIAEEAYWNTLAAAAGLPRPKVWTATAIQLLAEVANHLAKVVNEAWYQDKVILVADAIEAGASWGWDDVSQDWAGSCCYVCTVAGGTCSFHDPTGALWNELHNVRGVSPRQWEHPWSGVMRQSMSLQLFGEYVSGGGDLLEEIVARTAPPTVEVIGDYYGELRKDTLSNIDDFDDRHTAYRALIECRARYYQIRGGKLIHLTKGNVEWTHWPMTEEIRRELAPKSAQFKLRLLPELAELAS